MEQLNYEKYCSLLKETGSGGILGQQLKLIQALLISFDKEDMNSWDSISQLSPDCLDFFTEILQQCEHSCLKIVKNPKTKVKRHHQFMFPQQVKAMDSYCINWLSRQPGRNKKEKIMQSKTILGVKRTETLDTGENRLFKYFLQQVFRYIHRNQQEVPCELRSTIITQFQRKLSKFQQLDPWNEVLPWTHLPPNNTLLSHPDYAIKWQSWVKLQQLDDDINELYENIDRYLCFLFLTYLLGKLQKLCYCPQQPLEFSREKGNFFANFYCVDGAFSLLEIINKPGNISVKFQNKVQSLQMIEGKLSFSFYNDSEGHKKTKITEEKGLLQTEFIQDYVTEFLKPLQLTSRKDKENCLTFTEKNILFLDPFSLYPYYSAKEVMQKSPKRLLLQKFTNTNEVLLCHESSAILLEMVINKPIKTHSMLSSLPIYAKEPENSGQSINSKLVNQLSFILPGERLCFISPDGLNEFILRDFQQNLRQVYEKVQSFPKSLGLAFHHQRTHSHPQQNNLLVVDLLGNHISFTILTAVLDETLLKTWNIPWLDEYIELFSGHLWERHPTFTTTVDLTLWTSLLDEKTQLSSLFQTLGIDSFLQLEEDLPFFLADKTVNRVDDNLKAILSSRKLDITPYLEEFSQQRFGTETDFTIITSSPHLSYLSGELLSYTFEENFLGCRTFFSMEDELSNTETTKNICLWRDKLPQLELFLGTKIIPLVKDNQKILPRFGKPISIPVDGNVTLSQGKSAYSFQVKKEDSQLMYQAKVERNTDITKDLECKLELFYEYGAAEPYQLWFIPENSPKNKMLVAWVPLLEDAWEDLEYPPFPEIFSLDELSNFKGEKARYRRNRLEDLCCKWVFFLEKGDITTKQDLESSNYILNLSLDSLPVEVEFSRYEIKQLLTRLQNTKYAGQESGKDTDNLKLCFDISPKSVENLQLHGNYWRKNTRTEPPFYEYYYDNYRYQGQYNSIAFRSNQFVNEDEFSVDLDALSFEIFEGRNGKLAGKNIRPASTKNRYHGVHIMTKQRRLADQRWTMYRIFFNGRGLEALSPKDTDTDILAKTKVKLLEKFNTDLPKLLQHYEDNPKGVDMSNLFLFLCLLHQEMGADFYQLCIKRVETAQKNGTTKQLEDCLGFAFGNLSRQEERELFQAVQTLDCNKKILLYGKAIWNREDFLENVPPEHILELFHQAVDALQDSWMESTVKKGQKWYYTVAGILKFIFGVFRLRKGKVEWICRELSLNNKKMRELQGIVRNMDKELSSTDKKVLEQKMQLKATSNKPSDKQQKTEGILDVFLAYLIGQTEGVGIVFLSNDD